MAGSSLHRQETSFGGRACAIIIHTRKVQLYGKPTPSAPSPPAAASPVRAAHAPLKRSSERSHAMVLGLDTPLKQGIFATYVSLWVSSYLLVFASKQAGAPPYNATSVVLLTELVKLCMAVGLYLRRDGTTAQLVLAISHSLPLLMKYSIPAMLYCIYNNLVYVNLKTFDPGTYNVLMQLRIVITGVIYQQAFAKRLNRYQWAALVLISLGCMVKESAKLTSSEGLRANQAAWLLLLCRCSRRSLRVCTTRYSSRAMALAPPGGGGVTTNLPNAYMYFQSVAWMASSCWRRTGWVRPSRRTWRRSSRRPCSRSSASCPAWGS